jgi:hypothetical protein
MRNYLYILLPLFIIAFSCDEDNVSDSQSESFVKYYGGGFKDEGMRVISLSDGGYLLMGNIATPDKGKDICVIITDKYGNSTGPANLYGGNYDDYGNVIKKNDRGYVIGGSTQESKDGKKNIFLVQISENGTELLKKQISSKNNEEVYDLLVLDDQSLVLTGYITDPETSKNNMLLKKTNDSLAIDSTLIFKDLGFSSSDEVAFSIMKTAVANTYMLAGYTTDRLHPDDATKILQIIHRNQFNITAIYYPGNIEKNAYAVSLIPQEDNTSYVICNVNTETEKQIKVKKISVSGNKIIQQWEKYYGESESFKASYGFAQSNKLYVIGTSGSDNYGNILFLEIDNDGNLTDSRTIGDGFSFQGNGFDFTPDQGIIIAGSNKKNENSLITLIKLKSDYSL